MRIALLSLVLVAACSTDKSDDDSTTDGSETPGGDTDHSASRPSSRRNPPDMVEISGE